MNLRIFVISLLLFHSSLSWAWIPDQIDPLIVETRISIMDAGRVIDLTRAFERARSEQKPLFIYLDASDCPDCARYGRFIAANLNRFREIFEPMIVVDIRTELSWIPLVFKIGDKAYSFKEFKELVGDQNGFLTYPYFWLLGPDGKQLRQIPLGAFSNQQLEKHIELLRVPQHPPEPLAKD